MLEVQHLKEELNLTNIRVAPEYQGQGIGARLIGEVLREAYHHRLPVTLRVLKVNPARRLYERLGFAVVGETETHHLMVCSPPD